MLVASGGAFETQDDLGLLSVGGEVRVVGCRSAGNVE